MATISEVKAAEQVSSEPEQMADEDTTPVKVTETITDVDSDGDADKKEVKAEKAEPDDDTVENKSEKSDTEHSEAEDKPNDSDSDSDSNLEFTPDEVKSALDKVNNSTHVGGIADAIYGLSGPGRD